MPATLSLRAEFTWDPATLRYRRGGQFVSERAVKLGIRRIIRASEAELRAIGQQMARGEITLGEFQSRMVSELKNLHVSGAMAGQGGPANMDRNDYLRVGRGLKNQYRHFGKFADQIGRGELNENQIRARVEMYVKSQNGAYESGRQASAIAAGYEFERNVLGKNENHCHTGPMRMGCVELTALGWLEIGTMVPVGQRTCLSSCFCSLRFGKRRQPAPQF